MTIGEAIASVKALKGLQDYDEISTKQTIVLQVFHILGWNIFSRDEVIPEYAVESRRVDYSLSFMNRSLVFVEVKKPSENLDKHEKQLLDYAFLQGIKLAILTNGIAWWFYLPMLGGERWRDRKFYAIDILEQETEAISQKLMELLGKDNVIHGNALVSAERIHQNRKKVETIRTTLPEAWNNLIGAPHPSLIELLADATEKICGFKPQPKEVGAFLSENGDHILLETSDEPEVVVEVVKPTPPMPGSKPIEKFPLDHGGGPLAVLLDEGRFEGRSIPTLYKSVLKFLVDSGSINKAEVPWGVGEKRNFIYKGEKPVHKNGKEFFTPVTYKGFHLEAHINRSQGVKYLGALCARLGFKFKVIER